MSEEQATLKARSRRVLILWATALTLLISTALFCWLVLVPFLSVRGTVAAYAFSRNSAEEHALCDSRSLAGATVVTDSFIENLGGPDRAFRGLRLYLAAPDLLAPCKDGAAMLLADCGPKATHALIGALSHRKPLVRQRAAEALGRIGPAAGEAVPQLVQAMADPDDRVRMDAARALGFIGRADRDVVRVLAAALKDRYKWTRVNAVQALKELGPAARSAVPSLKEAVKRVDNLDDWSLACRAALALGAVAGSKAQEEAEAFVARHRPEPPEN